MFPEAFLILFSFASIFFLFSCFYCGLITVQLTEKKVLAYQEHHNYVSGHLDGEPFVESFPVCRSTS